MMTETAKNNYVFIDAQNLNLGVRALGWKLDYKAFRVYLKQKYHATKAFMFIGYLPSNTNLYRSLQEAGYVLIFKPVLERGGGAVKGNVDAELVLHAMIEYDNYDQALIVTSDGDFACLVEHLDRNEKLHAVMSPHAKTCSILLKRATKGRLIFIDDLRKKLQYRGKKKKGTP